MLTRLKVSGFKNLVDVDVSFGPFTCIAGPNGVGKSNLFDAIQFLSALADKPLIDAARGVRDHSNNNWEVRSLFHRCGERTASEMSFVAEMIVPQRIDEMATDDLAASVEATTTLLQYELVLTYAGGANGVTANPLRIVKENLTPIPRGNAPKVLPFKPSREWRASVLHGERRGPFISTKDQDGQVVIHLHQNKQSGRASGGRTFQERASGLARTVLSLTNSGESPTALIAKREMQSWRLLQLEPSALREPDLFLAPTRLASNGAHLPATLYRLAATDDPHPSDTDPPVLSRVGNRLFDLLGDIRRVQVNRDEVRQLLTLQVSDKSGTAHPARALSDGTLRFLALSVLAEDAETGGVICFEEPENGIHPLRIPAMLRLLKDIATDAELPVGQDNPLRQVIVNTHSPGVVQGVEPDDLVVASVADTVRDGVHFERAEFGCLNDTWRAKLPSANCSPLGELLAYLSPANRLMANGLSPAKSRPRRVIDRPDVRSLFDYEPESV